MAKIDRFNGNVQAFASQAQGTERTIFGDTAQSNTLDANLNTDFLRGWGIVGVNENPTKQDFAGLAFTLGQLISYLHQRGIPEWNTSQEFYEGSVVTTLEGIYRLKAGGTATVNPDSDNGVNWELAPTRAEIEDRVIRATSIAEVEDLSAIANHQVSLGGPTSGIFEFNTSNLSSEVTADPSQFNYIAPASDPTGASGAWVRLIYVGANLAEDVDAIATSGRFYTDGTTANRPLGESGTIESIRVDANTATQHYITFGTNRALYRGRYSGTWGEWYEISAQNILSSGWPTLTGDNLIDEVPTNNNSGWTTDGGTVTAIPAGLLFDNSSEIRVQADKTITGPTSGDYILYATVRADSIAGRYVQLNLGGAGKGKMTVIFGYNFVTGNAELNRISARFDDLGSGNVAGPILDFSAQDVEVAILYNAEFNAGTLFIKESGAWVGYGVGTAPDPYSDTVGIQSSSSGSVTLTLKEFFVSKPNIMAIGDSITEGATGYAPDPGENLTNYSSTWIAHANIYNNVRNNIIVNKGIGGQSSGQIAARIANSLSDASPQIVFLSAANNDYARPVSTSQRTINIQSSVNSINSAGAKVALYNAVYPSRVNPRYPAGGDYYRNWWETESAGITGVDLKINWMQGTIMDGNYMDTTYTQADGVHPNPAGYALLGGYIESLEP
jgi:lysophospholipase L1-like esterase